jgi:hypothetical protein
MIDSASPDWQTKAAAIKAGTLSKIPHDALISTESLPARVIDLNLTGTHLTPLEREIIQLDASDLRDRLADRSYTAVQVIGAYIKSAAVAHQATNCLTDLFADKASKRARWLDEQYEATGKPVGPLHGVPISVKVGLLFSCSGLRLIRCFSGPDRYRGQRLGRWFPQSRSSHATFDLCTS